MSTDRVWPVLFDQITWDADLAASSPRGREVAAGWRRSVEQDGGVRQRDLGGLRPKDHDGLHLPGSVKVYLPDPSSGSIKDSPWGAVLKLVDQPQIALLVLAFGIRHPEATRSTKPSVYATAHRRLFPAR